MSLAGLNKQSHVYWNIFHICNKFIPHPNVKDIKMGDDSSNQGSRWRCECFGLQFFLKWCFVFLNKNSTFKKWEFFINFSNIKLSTVMVIRPSKLLKALRYIWHKGWNNHTFCWIWFSNASNISSKIVLTSTIKL